jgi:hypothetical protein
MKQKDLFLTMSTRRPHIEKKRPRTHTKPRFSAGFFTSHLQIVLMGKSRSVLQKLNYPQQSASQRRAWPDRITF